MYSSVVVIDFRRLLWLKSQLLSITITHILRSNDYDYWMCSLITFQLHQGRDFKVDFRILEESHVHINIITPGILTQNSVAINVQSAST